MSAPAVSPAVGIRIAVSTDVAFIMRTWLETLRPEFPDMRDSDYFPWMRRKGMEALNEGAYVLYPPNEPDVIWGFLVGEAGCAHFVYVRPAQRKLGYARMLLEAIGAYPRCVVTAMTPAVRVWKKEHPDALRYIPL